jgi:hypothetical protein
MVQARGNIKRSALEPAGKDTSGINMTPARILLLLSFVASLILLLAVGLGGARADDGAPSSPPKLVAKSVKPLTDKNNMVLKGAPLVVPVYPRGMLDKHKSKAEDFQFGSDLQDSYIIMQDGSVLSVADWILGGLKKNQVGAGMTDYESRLFLGQVARAMAGLDENMVHQDLLYKRPEIAFASAPPPGIAMQTLQSVVGLVVNMILPGTPEGWHPAKTGGAFSPLMKSGGNAAIQFENQFQGAMMWSVQDIRDAGIYRTMLDEQKAKLAKEAENAAAKSGGG